MSSKRVTGCVGGLAWPTAAGGLSRTSWKCVMRGPGGNCPRKSCHIANNSRTVAAKASLACQMGPFQLHWLPLVHGAEVLAYRVLRLCPVSRGVIGVALPPPPPLGSGLGRETVLDS